MVGIISHPSRHLECTFLSISRNFSFADKKKIVFHWSTKIQKHFRLIWQLEFLICQRRKKKGKTYAKGSSSSRAILQKKRPSRPSFSPKSATFLPSQKYFSIQNRAAVFLKALLLKNPLKSVEAKYNPFQGHFMPFSLLKT